LKVSGTLPLLAQDWLGPDRLRLCGREKSGLSIPEEYKEISQR